MSPRIIDDDEIDTTSYNISNSPHAGEIRTEAIKCIKKFFSGREYWAGGAIAKAKLYKEEHIKAVMEMNIMDALAIAYYCLERSNLDTVDTTKKGWDIELCYECLKQIEQTVLDNDKIPKCHAGGILLIYLSMCHGVDFIPTLKKLSEIKTTIAKRERESEIKLLMKEQEKDDK